MVLRMLKLLNALWGDMVGYAEIRALHDSLPAEQHFFKWPEEQGELEERVSELRDTHNIFFGVNLRTKRDGSARSIDKIPWVWADVDKKSGATFSSLLSAPVPPPQIVVDSGHGWHLYWKMYVPLNHSVAQNLMQDIASQVGGDAVGDAPRILRLPETFNLKDPDNPLRVRILRMKNLEDTWRLGDFVMRRRPSLTPRRSYTGLLPATRGTRSEVLFHFVLDELRKGTSDEDIYEKMLELPEGSKLLEMRTEARRKQWIELTLRKAKRHISTLPRT